MRIFIIIAFTIAITVGCKSNKISTDEATTNIENRRADRGDRQGPPSVDEIFKMDANNDGKLSETEVTGRLKENFDKIDSDKDGFITKEEFENAPRPERGQRKRRNNN